MPKFLENKLRAHVPAGVNPDRYVYGAMNNMGAMKGSKITAKGREMEKKHEAKMAKEAAPHKIREMRIEVHRGPKNEVTGHTIHHHMMPSAASKSGAFMENTEHSYPFGADGESSTHGHMLDHIAKHLGMGEAEEEAGEAEE